MIWIYGDSKYHSTVSSVSHLHSGLISATSFKLAPECVILKKVLIEKEWTALLVRNMLLYPDRSWFIRGIFWSACNDEVSAVLPHAWICTILLLWSKIDKVNHETKTESSFLLTEVVFLFFPVLMLSLLGIPKLMTYSKLDNCRWRTVAHSLSDNIMHSLRFVQSWKRRIKNADSGQETRSVSEKMIIQAWNQHLQMV